MRMNFLAYKSTHLQAEANGSRTRRNSLCERAGSKSGEPVSKEHMIAALDNLNELLSSPIESSPEAPPGH